MSPKQIVLTVFFYFCFKTSAGCRPDPNFNNVTTCGSIEDFKKAGNHPEWTSLAIRNQQNKPKQILKNDAFKNVPNLKMLVLDAVINEFEEYPFRGLDKLENLTLEYNDIQEFPEVNIFNGLPLSQLDIRDSKLDSIPANYFRNLINLRQLDLSKNAITSMGDCALCDLNNTMIGLSNNRINSFDTRRILGNTSLIEQIDLDSNNLTQIPRFEQMFNLREAKFSDNFIMDIDPEAFLHSPKLVSLDISYNAIDDIPITALPKTIRTDEKFDLNIIRNHFDCLSEELRYKLSSLGRIAVELNPWNCYCLQEIKNWANELNATINCEVGPKCKVTCFDSERDEQFITM